MPLSDEKFEEIISRLKTTPQGIYRICRDLRLNTSDFYKYLNTNEEHALRYARAKEIQTDIVAEEMVDIADGPIPTTQNGYDSAAVQDKKVRIETRKWLMGKLRPKKYGDKYDVTSGGEALPKPPQTLIFRVAKADDAAD